MGSDYVFVVLGARAWLFTPVIGCYSNANFA
jgi:hypothetical protein